MNYNPGQQRAVDSESFKILCVAGAGTGKTKALTGRISRLINERVGSSNILALTFTRMAGKEMKERVIQQVGKGPAKDLFCNTFHAFGLKVINEQSEEFENFQVLDEADREDLIETIKKQFGITLTMKKIMDEWENPIEDKIKFLKNEYLFRLKENNALDLDLILEETLKILRTSKADIYRKQYDHIFVDEFQDSNKIQVEIIQALNPQNLFCVGDPDQSIYQWRGAVPEYMINFQEHFGEYELIKLEQNYRSTVQIVDVANKVIRNNLNRVDKNLISNKQGEPVKSFRFTRKENEAEEIIFQIANLKNQGDYSDICILARTNAYIDRVISRLEFYGIPFEVVGRKTDIFNEYMVKDVLGHLQFIYNKNDFMARKIFQNNISKIELSNIEMKCTTEEIGFWEVLKDYPGSRALKEKVSQIKYLEDNLDYINPREAYKKIIQVQDLLAELSKMGLKKQIDKQFQAMERIQRWMDIQEELGEPKDLGAFIKYLTVRDIQNQLMFKTKDKVKVMTIHGSKGLEWKYVFLVGLNDGIFPHRRSLDNEEERNLMYVATTRAKDILYLSWIEESVNDFTGKVTPEKPSRFLIEGGILNG